MVSDIPAGEGKIASLFSQCTHILWIGRLLIACATACTTVRSTLSVVGLLNTCISLIVLVKVLTDVVSEKVSLVCVELSDIPSPAGMSLIKLSLARNNSIIPANRPSRLGTGMSLTFFYSALYISAAL